MFIQIRNRITIAKAQLADSRARQFAQAHVKAVAAYATLALMIALYLMPQAATHASVTLTIDTDVLFGSINDWISVFIQPLSIGIGIAVALALITFIGMQIVGAFRGARVR